MIFATLGKISKVRWLQESCRWHSSMRCLSSQQTFFCNSVCGGVARQGTEVKLPLSTGGDFYESSRRRSSSRKPHTYIFFWSLDESISSFFGKKKKRISWRQQIIAQYEPQIGHIFLEFSVRLWGPWTRQESSSVYLMPECWWAFIGFVTFFGKILKV